MPTVSTISQNLTCLQGELLDGSDAPFLSSVENNISARYRFNNNCTYDNHAFVWSLTFQFKLGCYIIRVV